MSRVVALISLAMLASGVASAQPTVPDRQAASSQSAPVPLGLDGQLEPWLQCVELDGFFNAHSLDPLDGTARDLEARLAILRETPRGPCTAITLRLVDEVLSEGLTCRPIFVMKIMR